MIHWSWGVFVPIVTLLVVAIFRNEKNRDRGGYFSFDLITPFLVIILIAYILIWGGIFWW